MHSADEETEAWEAHGEMELVFRSCPLEPKMELFKNLRYGEGRGYIFLEDSASFA